MTEPEAQPQGVELLPCPWCKALPRKTDLAPSQRYRLDHEPECYLHGRMTDMRGNSHYVYMPLSQVESWNTRADLPRATADADGDVPRGFWPTLVDRGDGVEGHYCIGRLIEPGKSYWEFWNHGKWLSSGQVYVDKSVALAALANIRATPRATRETTVEACLAELRELGLEGCVTSKIKTTGRAEWMITIGGYFGHFQGSTLDECMIEIRAWSSKSAPLHRLKQRGEKGR